MGRRTSLHGIQALARRHPGWYRADLATLFQMLARGEIAPRVARAWSPAEVRTPTAGLAAGSQPGTQIIAMSA